jgi:hypothetical protein
MDPSLRVSMFTRPQAKKRILLILANRNFHYRRSLIHTTIPQKKSDTVKYEMQPLIVDKPSLLILILGNI